MHLIRPALFVWLAGSILWCILIALAVQGNVGGYAFWMFGPFFCLLVLVVGGGVAWFARRMLK